MIQRCDLKKQYRIFRKDMLKAADKVFGSGRYILGDECALFEKEFARYNGSKYAVSVANGTEALYLALKALNVGREDEVITSPFTPVPTVSAIVMAGARPAFVDIEQDSLNMNVSLIEKAITKRTKAVMPVHLFGNVVKMDKLNKIAAKHKLQVVEDACQAHGSALKGRKAGSWGELGCFSFYPTKNLGGYGDGGMVVTDDPKLDKKLRLLRDYGRDSIFTTVIPGVNSRLDEVQAAILRIKLRKLDSMNRQRVNLAKMYFARLKDTPLRLPVPDKGTAHNYHVFTATLARGRDGLRKHLDRAGIQNNAYYPIAMHLQKAYSYLGYKRGDFPVAERMCKEVIALPMYPELEGRAVAKICREILGYFK